MTTTIIGGIIGAATIIVPGLIAVYHDRQHNLKQCYKEINLWEEILYG